MSTLLSVFHPPSPSDVSLSIDSIYTATHDVYTLTFCDWLAGCSVAGLSHDTPGQCSKAKLGYTFDNNVQAALNTNGVDVKSINRALTAVLVLHPIGTRPVFPFHTEPLTPFQHVGSAS